MTQQVLALTKINDNIFKFFFVNQNTETKEIENPEQYLFETYKDYKIKEFWENGECSFQDVTFYLCGPDGVIWFEKPYFEDELISKYEEKLFKISCLKEYIKKKKIEDIKKLCNSYDIKISS
jgi:hypothetical protein